ncbi:substrate-binding domain-containing protein [Rouxiella sp. Mn2063]|uniref:substrate-binding domain-containing protein n=1 Tax=Rouxiella sp. Mn2063 TaxID=3395262 RepID=UPI003BC6FE5A
MANTLNVLAAGSLRKVWLPMMATFTAQSGIHVTSNFGPAGLLRQRIEQGEKVDLFASANTAHPQTLLDSGKALRVESFASNSLCLTVSKAAIAARFGAERSPDWLVLLNDVSLRVATSTPLADPSGDYTWQLFDKIEQAQSGAGELLRKRAMMLVGGPQSSPVPTGELAAAWLIRTGQCDLFIGYASYAPLLRQQQDLQVIDIPLEQNIRAEYALALCHSRAESLADFILSALGQDYLSQAGFASVT